MERIAFKWNPTEIGKMECPFCGSDDYIGGPQGGGCRNFKCCNCGAQFNYVGPFGIELIDWPEKKPYQLTT